MNPNEFIERNIAIGLIISTGYIKLIRPVWRNEYILSPEVKRIAQWCLGCFDQYNITPERDISSLYMDALKADVLSKEEAELIEGILDRISNDYNKGEIPVNPDYLYNQTIEYYRRCALKDVHDILFNYMENNKLNDAEELLLKYKRPVLTIDDDSLEFIEMRPVRWLWPNRIPLGKVTVLAGRPATGKSQLTLDIVARTTSGGRRPTGERARLGAFLIASAEDDFEDTVAPRLTAAGADLSLCYEVGSDSANIAALCSDITLKLQGIKAAGKTPRGVITDPLSAYMDRVDAHSDAAVRSALRPLAQLARELGIAVIVVMHLRKSGSGSAMEQVSGSLAFVAAARAAYLITTDPDDDTRTLFLSMKNNLAAKKPGLAYRLVEAEVHVSIARGKVSIPTSKPHWLDEDITMTAEEAVASASKKKTKKSEVAEWLREELSEGAKTATEVLEAAVKAGFSERTVRQATKEIGIKPKKLGFNGGWEWALPIEED